MHGVMIDLHNCYNQMVLLEPTVFSFARRNVPAFKATPSANLLATFQYCTSTFFALGQKQKKLRFFWEQLLLHLFRLAIHMVTVKQQ